MINYIPIKINNITQDKVVQQLAKIFNMPDTIVNDNLTEFLIILNSDPDSIDTAFIAALLKKMIGEFLFYKGLSNDVMNIKFSFNKGYVFLFLIDKLIIIDNK